jgi:leucyl-tRNA synthetase
VADEAYTGDGSIINSDFLNGLSVEEAKKLSIRKLEEKNQGAGKTTYRSARLGSFPPALLGLPDTGISIVIRAELVPVPEKELPVNSAGGCEVSAMKQREAR